MSRSSIIRPFFQKFSALILIVLFSNDAQADGGVVKEQEVVVTASRYPTKREEVGSSITVISEEQIRASQGSLITDVLRGIPGVDLVQSGGNGGNAAVFLRGANSEHTLVLIDGIEANNPITTNRSFNFANLSLNNVERIEILRGPQSTMYGSDALGGVINIITKQGKGEPSGSVSFEGGSFSTFVERANIGGSTETVNYSFAVSQENSNSISAAESKLGNGESDPYQNTGISGRVGIKANENVTINNIIRYNTARTDLDNNGGVGGDDPNRLLKTQDLFARTEAKMNFLGGKLNPKIGFSYTNQQFVDNNNPDADHPVDLLRSNFNAETYQFDAASTYDISDEMRVLLGMDSKSEQGGSFYSSDGSFGPFTSEFPDKTIQDTGVFTQGEFHPFEGFVATAGVRIDDHSKTGSRTTWRIAPTYHIDETGTRFFGSVGTGFKSPSLYQLYSPYGSLELSPEKSLGWDAGAEQTFFDERITLSGTYFHNAFKQLISFDPQTLLFENISRASSQGLEFEGSVKATEFFDINGSYTYTDTLDEDTGEALLRRPKNKFQTGITYKPTTDLRLGVSAVNFGKRWDNDFSTYPASRVALGGYTTVNLTGSYDLSKEIQLFARVDNLFDKEYEEVLGFGTRGVGGYGGVRVSF